ncbi:MAG: DUF4147 domain-containing protein [Thermoplasmata archaeon]
MSDPFPFEPFPTGGIPPAPKGPDPVPAMAFQAAVEGSDAYRGLREALQVDEGVLRLGNRFLPVGRYREVAFLALGEAAHSLAFGALTTLGARVTAGLVAGAEPPPADFPFPSVRVVPGEEAKAVEEVARAATELLEALTERDLFLLLLSSGAVTTLAAPPEGFGAAAWQEWLKSVALAGASAREIETVVRVVGGGLIGGRLGAIPTRGDRAVFVVDRGHGPALLGGGPTIPIAPAERLEVRDLLLRLQRTDGLPASTRERLGPAPGPDGVGSWDRPVVIAQPSDAVRSAADRLFDRKWTSRLIELELSGPPEAAATRFVEGMEELLQKEPLTPESRTKGIAGFAMTTLDVPEGAEDGPAMERFLARAYRLLRRREMTIAVGRTAGAPARARYPAGAAIGRIGEPAEGLSPGRPRPLAMRSGITDVGALVVGLVPTPAP